MIISEISKWYQFKGLHQLSEGDINIRPPFAFIWILSIVTFIPHKHPFPLSNIPYMHLLYLIHFQ